MDRERPVVGQAVGHADPKRAGKALLPVSACVGQFRRDAWARRGLRLDHPHALVKAAPAAVDGVRRVGQRDLIRAAVKAEATMVDPVGKAAKDRAEVQFVLGIDRLVLAQRRKADRTAPDCTSAHVGLVTCSFKRPRLHILPLAPVFSLRAEPNAKGSYRDYQCRSERRGRPP